MDADLYLVKTDQNGNQVWEKTFGEMNKINRGFSVQQTKGGGYIAVGVKCLMGTTTFTWSITGRNFFKNSEKSIWEEVRYRF